MTDRGMNVILSSLILGSSPKEGRFAILAAPGSSLNSPQDLKGVPIGISSNTIIEYVTESLLTGAGLTESEIVKEEIKKMPVRFQMLIAGQIEAATLPDPLAFFAQSKGAKLIIDDTSGENISQVVLLLMGNALKEKGPQIKQMYEAYDKQVDNINRSPDSYRQILVEKARLPKPISLTYSIDRFLKARLPDRDSIDRVIQWAKNKGLVFGPVTYDHLTGRSPLK
jgi:NitT/TauT family transport system substrate-binding protein